MPCAQELGHRKPGRLAGKVYGRAGDTKSGRGGRALLAGLICCVRCGRRLKVSYRGRYPRPVYGCDTPNLQLGQKRCFRFGGKRIDDAIAAELLAAVAPLAIEAAREAERMLSDEDQDRRRITEMELSQARYDASLAERRYAACDPDNRLIAAQLEKAWEAALQRVEACRQRLDAMATSEAHDARPDLTGLADDLFAAWKAPATTMRTRQRLVHALITEITADMTRRPARSFSLFTGRAASILSCGSRSQEPASMAATRPSRHWPIMRAMAGRWSDQDIAASLNRMGMPTGQGKTWTAHRVGSIRRVNGIHGHLSAEKNSEWLTLRDAAAKLGSARTAATTA
jgi:hypothetical protein